jgi:hypothetical protein
MGVLMEFEGFYRIKFGKAVKLVTKTKDDKSSDTQKEKRSDRAAKEKGESPRSGRDGMRDRKSESTKESRPEGVKDRRSETKERRSEVSTDKPREVEAPRPRQPFDDPRRSTGSIPPIASISTSIRSELVHHVPAIGGLIGQAFSKLSVAPAAEVLAYFILIRGIHWLISDSRMTINPSRT